MNKEIKFNFYVIAVLKFLDVFTTFFALKFISLEEQNPMMKDFIDFNLLMALFVSFTVTIGVLYLMLKYVLKVDYQQRFLTNIMGTILSLVVMLNIFEIYKNLK